MGPFGGNRDEFDRTCEEIINSGFEFVYNNRRLSKSKMIYQHQIRQIPTSKSNSEMMFVKCKSCNIYMDFVSGPTGVLDGNWVCPNCGTRVRERTAYTQLDKENTEFLDDWDLDE